MLRNVAGQVVEFSLFKSGARIANPTMAAGDFTRDLDGAGQSNVTTLPTSDAAGLVTWLPSQAETNAAIVALLCNDVAGAEWEPITLVFETAMPTSVAAIEVDTGTTLDGRIPAVLVGGRIDASVGAMAADVITAAAHDESTAYPIAAADTGATQIARVGADADTLETLSDQIDGVAVPGSAMALTAGERTTLVAAIWAALTSALTTVGSIGKLLVDRLTTAIDAAVWAYATRTLTQSAAAVAAAVAGSAIAVRRGDTVTIALTGLGSLVGRSKLWFTIKTDYGHSDANALVQVRETAGLLVLNGAAPVTPITAADATLVVDSEALGNITITLKGAATAELTPMAGLYYDVQMLVGTNPTTLTAGTASVVADVTRATS